jgi:hypothetical protein
MKIVDILTILPILFWQVMQTVLAKGVEAD